MTIHSFKGFFVALMAAGVLLLSGCGGSSSSGGGTSGFSDLVANQTTLTEDNAQEAFVQTFDVADEADGMVGFFGQIIGELSESYDPCVDDNGAGSGGSVEVTKAGGDYTVTLNECRMVVDEDDGTDVYNTIDGSFSTKVVDKWDSVLEKAYSVSFDIDYEADDETYEGHSEGSYQFGYKGDGTAEGPPPVLQVRDLTISDRYSYSEGTSSVTDSYLLSGYSQSQNTESTPSTAKMAGKISFKRVSDGTTEKAYGVELDAEVSELEYDGSDHPKAGTITVSGASSTKIVVDYTGDESPQVTVKLNGSEVFPEGTSYTGTYEDYDSWINP